MGMRMPRLHPPMGMSMPRLHPPMGMSMPHMQHSVGMSMPHMQHSVGLLEHAASGLEGLGMYLHTVTPLSTTLLLTPPLLHTPPPPMCMEWTRSAPSARCGDARGGELGA